MKKLFLSTFLYFSVCGFAQDTLYFKNSSKTIVIVKEVSQTEIQYKKYEVPDGPMYIINKNDLEKIVYKNGYSEIIKASEQQPAIVNSPMITQYTSPAVNLEKITYADTKRRYKALVNLINEHPDPSRKSILMDKAMNLRSLKRQQDATRTIAIIFGGVAIAGTALYTLVYAASGGYNNDVQILAVPPVIFGTGALILGSASIAINMNLKSKRKAFVDLYNQ